MGLCFTGSTAFHIFQLRLRQMPVDGRRVASFRPYAAQIQKSLIISYVTMKDYARAQEALERYVELLPGDTFMHRMLEKVEWGKP